MRKLRYKTITNTIIIFTCVLFLCIITLVYYNKTHPYQNKTSYRKNKVTDISEIFNTEKVKYLDQNTPRNLFISFTYATFNAWCGWFKEMPLAVKCITVNPKAFLTNTERTKLQIKCMNLSYMIYSTPFSINDIPKNVPGNTCEIKLGFGDKANTYFLAKRKNGSWYFSNRNFSNSQLINITDKFKDEFIFVNEKGWKYTTPLACYTYFMLGALNLANLNTETSRELLDLNWVAPIIRETYGDFLVFQIRKALEEEKINIYSIPVNPPKNEQAVTLCTCSKTGLTIYLQKKYLDKKERFTWIFNKQSQINALENCIATKVVLKPVNPKDPLWFQIQHVMTTYTNNCLGSVVFYLLLTLIGSIIIVYAIYIIFKKILYTILNKLDKTHNKNFQRLAKSISLLISLNLLELFTYHCFIFYYNLFIWFTYFLIVAYGIVYIWITCELINLISTVISTSLKKDREDKFRALFIIEIMKRILSMLTVIVFTGLIMQKLGINMVNFLAALGIGGIAIAYAGKDTIENLFGSIAIAFEKPFEIGDWIIVGNIEGTVEHVGLRSTRIRTFQDSYITIPNVQFITSYVDNMDKRNYRRYYTTLEVDNSNTPELLQSFIRGIEEIIKVSSNIKQNEYHIRLNDFGHYSLKIMIYLFFTATDWETELNVRENFILEVLKLSKKLNIKMSYATVQKLYLAKYYINKTESAEPLSLKEFNKKNLKLKDIVKRILTPNKNDIV